MTDDWRETTLGEVVEVTISNVDKKTKPDEIPVRLCNYTDVYYNQHIRSNMDFMDATATQREISRCSLYAGDVVITKDSEKDDDIGVPAYISEDIEDLVCGYHLVILRPKPEDIEGAYLFYSLNAKPAQHQFHARANGVTRFGLRKADIGTVTVPLPPLPEQRRIAHILGTLDDKIELNRRMNETLEEMARAIFKDWFVEFGPVRAKMEGRDPYLPEDVWSLFPERLVASELGEIPEGWVVKRLGEVYDLTMGQSPPGRTYNDDGDGIAFFQGRTDFGFRYPTNRRYCTSPTRFADEDDTLVSVRAPVGDINMAWERSCVGRGLAALRHKSESRSFTYYSALALQDRFRDYEHTGTVFGSINKQQFEALLVIEPDENLVATFELQVGSLDTQIRMSTSDVRMIESTRDSLLPRLVSRDMKTQIADKVVKHNDN